MTEVTTFIAGVLEIDPAADAIEWEGRWLTWGGLTQKIDDLNALLDSLAVPKGARVGMMLRNRLPQLASVYTMLLGGRCIVTINPLYPDGVVSADIAALELPVLIGERADLEREGVLDALTGSGGAAIALAPSWEGKPEIIRGPTEGVARSASGDVMIEMLSSGTTGKPKRIMLGKRAFQRSFEAALHYEAGRSGDAAPRLRPGVQILMSPLTHIAGIWGCVNTLAAGRKLVLLEKFKIDKWRYAVSTYKPKVATVGAAGLRMILDANVPKEELASLRALTAGAAPVEPAVIDTFLERYDIAVLTNYGATEFAGAVAGWSMADFREHWKDRRGSCGRIHGEVQARVVDMETGDVLGPMEEGVLELKSQQLADPDAWLRTTDKAKLSDDKFLWITGRADEAINRGGFKVHPREIASALESHPAVREAVVVGISDPRLGAAPAAAVLLSSDAVAPTVKELDAYLRGKLLPYQVPVFYAFYDEVPRTASMKPILPEVKALLEAARQDADAA